MAVSRAEKEQELQDLSLAFKSADTAIVVDYKGLNVPQVTHLRRELRKVKATYKVVKNTIAKRAIKGTAFEVLSDHFVGTTAIAYTDKDPVALAKTLVDFAKQHEVFQLRAGVLEGKALDKAEIATLATLPSLDELRARLVGVLSAPAQKLVMVLSAPAAQLARVTEARSRKLAEGGAA